MHFLWIVKISMVQSFHCSILPAQSLVLHNAMCGWHWILVSLWQELAMNNNNDSRCLPTTNSPRNDENDDKIMIPSISFTFTTLIGSLSSWLLIIQLIFYNQVFNSYVNCLLFCIIIHFSLLFFLISRRNSMVSALISLWTAAK